ncbi:alpha/beta hydrolase [Bacteroides thetaiotaomicron]|uniref:Alpha/beta hydrolase n=1 Tax=Bacteroides thetaiotaomicron TaxID=818 RepID=A0A7J5JUK7_BACT4|nr:alpha/beta hydrolase [Bacteroides thetaiotaomicron]KAB4455139.1 alpha/beta hydrolase [Bacteroides thetaiotaomicron]MCA6027935.1 alpha/beta hydrolase [Bacteroides thetaiotaomicron]MCE9150622.1 alpha/beta hydrolase [Bacteroides thetaiotaomicron]QUT40419.1 Chlorophyllase enzyme [Bacteroides thetaiotaomicron]
MCRIIILLISLILSVQCFSQTEFTTCLFDISRNKVIPIAVYQPQKVNSKTKVIIFSHGYDGNKNSKSNRTYSYLTRFLSQKGFYVISIQHELSDDPLLAMEGDLMQTRMSNWERGTDNILFTIQEFKNLKPQLNWRELILMGHSNGGDMTMLFATKYPQLISKAISMDHRRMIMPRTLKPRLYTLRGCDYEADAGVLPTGQEQEQFRMKVVKLDGVTHSDMGENGTTEQHDLINQHICKFLTER